MINSDQFSSEFWQFSVKSQNWFSVLFVIQRSRLFYFIPLKEKGIRDRRNGIRALSETDLSQPKDEPLPLTSSDNFFVWMLLFSAIKFRRWLANFEFYIQEHYYVHVVILRLLPYRNLMIAVIKLKKLRDILNQKIIRTVYFIQNPPLMKTFSFEPTQ